MLLHVGRLPPIIINNAPKTGLRSTMRTPAWGLFPTSIMIWCDGGLERIGTAAQTRTPARTQCIASLRRLYSWMRQETHILSPRRYVYKLCEPLGEHGANTKKVILIKEGAKIKTSPVLSASPCLYRQPRISIPLFISSKELSSSLSCSPSLAKENKRKQRRSIEGFA